MTRAAFAALLAWPFILSAAAPATRVSLVMYPGQQTNYTTAAPLLTVTASPQGSSAVVARFEQYRNGIRLAARSVGETKLLCEHADNRIGEVLLINVVPQPVHDRYQRAVTALTGVEGLDPNSVTVSRSRVFVSGSVYSMHDLQRCLDLQPSFIICAVRLSPAATAIHPELGFAPRASLELTEEPELVESADIRGMEGRSRWSVIIRFGDVPVFSATALDRAAILDWSLQFVTRVNEVATIVAKRASSGHKDAVVFRIHAAGNDFELSALWNLDEASRSQLIARVPLSHLADVASKAGAAPERLVAWWAAILQDAFRSYILGERPFRSAGDWASPLTGFYEDALRLQGSTLDLGSAPVALARASFSMQFASGKEPFTDLLTTIPPAFTAP